jgi:N-methylhydantoinase A
VTVTDANLILGRLNPAYFLGGQIALDVDLAREQVHKLGRRLGLGAREAAQAIIDIANENMANALRVLSINRGLDPREFALVAFGGAGPLHGASIARMIGMERVLVPPYPGLCSAFGTLLADLQVNRVLSTNVRSDRVTAATVEQRFGGLVATALEELRQEGYRGEPRVERSISTRYWGQNYEHDVKIPDGPIDDAVLQDAFRAFNRIHEEFYGYSIQGEIIELIRFNVTAFGPMPKPALVAALPADHPWSPSDQRPVYFQDRGTVQMPIYRREELPAGTRLDGPVIVEEVDSTILAHPGQHLIVEESGIISIHVPRRQ